MEERSYPSVFMRRICVKINTWLASFHCPNFGVGPVLSLMTYSLFVFISYLLVVASHSLSDCNFESWREGLRGSDKTP